MFLGGAAAILALGLVASPPAASTPAQASTPAAADAPALLSPYATAGSVAVGAAAYAVPSGAIVVSPSGNDANPGTLARPVRTLTRGLVLAPSGGAVVLRAGVYRENVTINRKVTVQNYPREAVWLDGSSAVTGWVADGTTWRRDGWTTRFDHSPTYTRGAPDSTQPGWQFVNPKTYPMAAHPDQFFVNGAALRQVKSRALVVAGTFFLDESTSKLYIGTNPTGRAVEGSTLFKAMSIRAAGTVVRGIGVRRYSPSVWHIAGITVEAPASRVENVVIQDMATTGISVQREDNVLDRVTVQRSGMLGVHARFADRIQLLSVLATRNNSEHFNIAPNSGGAKFGATRGVTVRGSSFSGNYGPGLWEDLSVYNSVFTGSSFSDNSGAGLFLEISAKAIVANNLFARNASDGIKVNNTTDVQIWNNTFVGNGRPLNLVQDTRRNTNRDDQAVDPRQPFPDATMPWTLGPVTVRNNVVAQSTKAANCLLCVEDYSHKASGAQLGVTADGNAYHRTATSAPTWIAVWSRGATNVNPLVFTSLSALTSVTGQEVHGRSYVGLPIVSSAGVLSPLVALEAPRFARPLPANIASLVGRSTGTVHLGKW